MVVSSRLSAKSDKIPEIEVTGETTLEAAERLAKDRDEAAGPVFAAALGGDA